jgi:hypothetical protein
MPVYKLLTNATTVSSGDPVSLEQLQDSLSIQVILVGTGSITAVINTMGSADGVYYFKIATTSMVGTTSATEGFTIKDPWQYLRADIIAISGTSATVNTLMVA